MIINLKKAFSFTEFLIDIDTVKGGVKKIMEVNWNTFLFP